MTKYKQYVDKMLSENKKVFDEFRLVHDKYTKNPDNNQKEFNEKGEKVQEIVMEYENRLCSATEKGMYNKYSAGLAEKFQSEVRKTFPMIDHIGIKVTVNKPPQNQDSELLNFKKIKLF